MGIWEFWGFGILGCSGCEMFLNVGCSVCGMLEMCDVWNVGCSDAECSRCGMLVMWDVWDVEC